MRADLISEMYRLEETHWWHVAKRRLVLRFLQPFLPLTRRNTLFLDIGCGTGMMLSDLSSHGRVVGIDSSLHALYYCRKRGFRRVLAADLGSPLPLRSGVAHVVTMLDVLEHLETDEFALHEVYRVLRPGGRFILTVPSYPWLWTYWDEILGHRRRYRRSRLVRKLKTAGFQIQRSSYFYSYLLPLAVIFRATKTFLGSDVQTRSDFISLPTPLNRFLLFLSRLETEVVSKIDLPTGLSILCLCRKR